MFGSSQFAEKSVRSPSTKILVVEVFINNKW